MMRIWLRHTPRNLQWAAVIVALALSAGDSTMNSITGNEPSVFARFVPFVGYYLLGYLLRDTVVSGRGLAWCWVGTIATYLVLMLGTGWTVHEFHKPGTFLKGPPSMEMLQYDFLSPARVVMAEHLARHPDRDAGDLPPQPRRHRGVDEDPIRAPGGGVSGRSAVGAFRRVRDGPPLITDSESK